MAIPPGKARGQERQQANAQGAGGDKDQGLVGEGGKEKAQGHYCSEIVDKAGAEDAFAELGPVEAGFQHDGVDDRHRGGRKGHAGQPAGVGVPAESVTRYGRAAQERRW